MPKPSLAQEIRKRHPFASREEEVFLNLWRTFARLSEGVERLLRQRGLCASHYNILRILAGEKAAGDEALPALEVRRRLITPVPDITRLVDKLVEMGLISRRRDASDRRVVLLSLTDRGQRLVEELADPVTRLHRDQLGHMTQKDLMHLSALLEQARAQQTD